MNDEVLTPVVELEAAMADTQAVAISDSVKVALIQDLRPIIERLSEYELAARSAVVNSDATAKEVSLLHEMISEDIKTVEGHTVLSGIVDGLHSLHRRFTGPRSQILNSLRASKKIAKGKGGDWQDQKNREAAKESARLQAIEDEKKRKEKARLLKEAAALKTPEKKQERLEQAEAVVSRTIVVQAPKVGPKMQRRWRATVVNPALFLAACIGDRKDLMGYVEINTTRIQGTKSNNPLFDAPGIKLEQYSV